MDLRFYLSIALRRLPLVLLLTILGSALGATIALLLPPVYRAEATLVVESEQIPDELAASTVRVEATEQLQIIQQRILTRATLLEMANRLDIYADQPGQATRRLSADEVVEDLRERITIASNGGQQTNAGGVQATIVSVSFEAPTAQLSAMVTNELVTLILEENVEMRTRSAGQTLEFFNQEVDRLDRELTEKGAAIQAFQEGNRDALPDSLDFRRTQLVAEQERLLEFQRDESALRDRRARLVELYETTGQVGVASPSEALTPEERELQSLRNQLTAVLGVLSPSNPRITVLKNQIAALEAQVAAARGLNGVEDGERAALTAYDLQLADLDGALAIIAEQRQQTEARVAELLETIQSTPSNAITLDELQRDFDNTRIQYDLAVQRRALAQTGEMIETLSRGQRISVIEQAVPPEEPESPNRPLVAGAGLAGGLALGLGIAALLELANRSIRRPAELSTQLGIAPFAVVPVLRSRYDIRQRRRRIVLSLFVAVVLIPMGLWLVHTRVTPLDLLASRVLDRLAMEAQPHQDSFG